MSSRSEIGRSTSHVGVVAFVGDDYVILVDNPPLCNVDLKHSFGLAARFPLSGCTVPTEEAVLYKKILIANNGSEGAFARP
jgi:hypothetical protein